MSEDGIPCRLINLNGNDFEVGDFIGEIQIVSILAYRHDDKNGVNIILVTENNDDDQSIEHRGPYTLVFA